MKRIEVILNLLLLSLIIYTTYKIFTLKSTTFIKEEKISPKIKAKEEEKPLAHYSIIEKKNIFGLPKSPSIKLQEKEYIPPLELKGTIVGDEECTFAVIENKSTHKQILLRTGDEIEGLKVTQILEERVILNKNGRIFTLYLKEKPSLKPTSPEVRVVERKKVEEAKRRVNQILSKMRISPYFRGGKMIGFRVNYIVPGSIVDDMGIKKGDIIKSVNGEILDSPGRIFEIYHKFKNATKIVLEVERDGQIKTLVYQVEG